MGLESMAVLVANECGASQAALMPTIPVTISVTNLPDHEALLEALKDMAPDEATLEPGELENTITLQIDLPDDGRPLYQKGDAGEQALSRANEIVRAAKQHANKPDLYAETSVGIWPGIE
jgi:hypothetical protein